MDDAPAPRPPGLLPAVRARAAEALAFNRREVVALGLLGILVVVGATLGYVRARPADASAVAPLATSVSVEATAPAAVIVVHVAGAVRSPGVYEFTEGARVVEAIRAAGGLRNGADATAINLARILADGEQIIVPSRRAVSRAGDASDDDGGLININTASASELEALPGVGPVLAQRIVDHREANGPFTEPKDLLKVSGIGPKTFASIEPLITV